MNRLADPSKRTFLKAAVALGGGLLIGLRLPADELHAAHNGEGTPFAPNAWIRIGSDGLTTIIVDRSEMGQGVMTALPMLVAEELEVEWSAIRIEQAPAAAVYGNPLMRGLEATGGSTSVRAAWIPLREAGAAARHMLIAAAAATWGVVPEACHAEDGKVWHPASGRSVGFGAVAQQAAQQPVPHPIPLKNPRDFKLIGRSLKRRDTAQKVDGTATFAIDVKRPGLLSAAIVHCPQFGGSLVGVNAERAMTIKGVRHVVPLEEAVAVVADDYWSARRGLHALDIQWNKGRYADIDSRTIREVLESAAQSSGAVARRAGEAPDALKGAAQTLDVVYELPFLAHATMEPMSCVADVRGDGCDLWVGTQAQTRVQQAAARLTGLAPEAVKVHTTLLGSGFGRRLEVDFVVETVRLSQAVRAPVKLIWSREEDVQHDFYRPATYNKLSGGVSADGLPVAWVHRIAGPSIRARTLGQPALAGVDGSSVEGAADLPYAIPNVLVEYVHKEVGVPVGFWRSVGHSQNAFIVESFIDELAHAAGKDPYRFRRALLAEHPRHRAVLDLAASRAGWGKPLPRGRYQGIALHGSCDSYVAQVAEVSVSPRGEAQVHRVVCAVDCGLTVNPSIVRAQMESAIAFGLSAALFGDITIKGGRVEQSNFSDYRLLPIAAMPAVEVYLVPSTEAPGGIGEPGTPPIAPALANAVFAATGKRVRSLPIRPELLRRA